MATSTAKNEVTAKGAEWKVRHLEIIGELVNVVEKWAQELDWSTRRLEKKIRDPEMGDYHAPGLLMQKEFTRVMLEPHGRIGEGHDAVVDLYRMPEYDDIARLVSKNGTWTLALFDNSIVKDGTLSLKRPRKWTKKLFEAVLNEVCRDAA